MSEPNVVVGYIFDDAGENVAVIRKDRPAWCAGLLAGVGGKMESCDEDQPINTIIREAKEGCGIDTLPGDWTPFNMLIKKTLNGDVERIIYSFKLFDTAIYNAAYTRESEEIERFAVIDLLQRNDVLPELPWQILMALDKSIKASSSTKVVDEG